MFHNREYHFHNIYTYSPRGEEDSYSPGHGELRQCKPKKKRILWPDIRFCLRNQRASCKIDLLEVVNLKDAMECNTCFFIPGLFFFISKSGQKIFVFHVCFGRWSVKSTVTFQNWKRELSSFIGERKRYSMTYKLKKR